MTDQLFSLVYDELRRMAGGQMSKETPAQTLQPTALVHEAYERLLRNEPLRWQSRGHFFHAAATAMRRILIDRARAKDTAKRSPNGLRVPLDEATSALDEMPVDDILALDDVLTRLEQRDARKASVVNLKFFAGLTNEDTAKALGVSLTTVKDDWQFARAWLHRELNRHE